ncbi:phage regulatory CII family protein [Marinobacter sp. VGCF2001]|uniref:phage regulatory CII family protein n=1 Tax=Marinobacter sp. VGCF2001 TaxID=3417189 RepID=UPI003CF709C9
MLTWPTLEDWSLQVARQLHTACRDHAGKAAGLFRELKISGRPVRDSERAFQNALTPTTETHQLRFDEFWHLLDLVDNRSVVHALCRQMNLLVAPVPREVPVSQNALFGVFAGRNRELAQTQSLLREILEEERPFSTIAAREAVLREMYEDFCESLYLLFMLEGTYLIHASEAAEAIRNPWQIRFQALEARVAEEVEGLAERGDPTGTISDQVIRAALKPNQGLQLSLPNFMKVLFLDGSRELAHCFATSLGYGISPLPTLAWHSEEQSLIRTYAELESRQAGTTGKISDALKDEWITSDELKSIFQELVDEHQAQVRLVMSAGIMSEPAGKAGA